MGKFKHMPEAIWPDEKVHIDYPVMFRATKNVRNLK